MALAEQIQDFRDHIVEGGVLDPEGTHHEFVSGMHGRKLDFDTIDTYVDPLGDAFIGNAMEFTPLYNEWIQTAADYIKEEFDKLPKIILGVANGTNRVARHTADRLGKGVTGIESKKDEKDSKVLRLLAETEDYIRVTRPKLVVVIEDVGTTGSNSVQVAVAAKEAGAKRVVVVTTWKRREQLERLDEAGVEYQAIIDEPLPTYSPGDCVKTGFCSEGWKFIRRGE